MIKLYLKTIALVLLLSGFVLSVNYFAYTYYTTKGFNHINYILTKGTFSYIQSQLNKTPSTQWGSTLKKLKPSEVPLAKILPINSLELNKKEKASLLDGDIVITTGKQVQYSYFLYYGLFETFAYQRIGHSQ